MQGNSTTTTQSSGRQRAQVLQEENDDPAQPAVAPQLGKSFADLPPELRAMIWRYALPGPREFEALTYVSGSDLGTQLLSRAHLQLPLAHVCFEARRAVRDAGYILAFGDPNEPDDPGVWFHPQKDKVERTIWAPGDIRHQEVE